MARRPTPKGNCSNCEHLQSYKYYSSNRWNFDGWKCSRNEVIMADASGNVCPKFSQKTDAVEEWDKAREGKPISEWPPMPDELEFIKYENGIVLTTQKKIEKWLKEAK